MFLSSKELKLFYSIAQYYSTKKLHKLEYYLTHKNTYPIYNQMLEIVQVLLIRRGEHNFLHQKIEEINYLDKCLSI